MKIMFCSDIHGSVKYTKMLLERFEKEQADKLIILGDLYYHGPRNPLSEEYSPIKVSELLNIHSDKIVAVCGNCDSEIDKTISQFPFIDDGIIDCADLRVYVTHGHRCSTDCLPCGVYDMFVCGHTHVGELFCDGGRIIANTGSVGLPKWESRNSYIVLDAQAVCLCDLYDGQRLRQIKR